MTHELTRGQTGIWTLLLCSSFLALTSCSVEVEGDAPDECSDGADNDQDGAADCNDESCAADLACTGGDDDDTGVGDDDDSSASTDDDDDNTAADDDSTTPGPNKTDDDGDGQSEVDGDCDDEDPNNFTGNTELCDGQDNDCNGEVSAGEVDLDEDGSLACADCDDGDDSLEELDTDGDGVTTCSGDCDDNDASVYPGAPENWNDGLDNDCDGMVDGSSPNCFASFTLDFPDGSSSIVDGCVAWSLDATYEYDPNDPPELNSLVLEFNATNSPGFECQVLIVQEEVCGTGYYDTIDSAQTLTYTTLDCGGVPNLYEDIYTASVGYMDLQVLNTGVTPGNFTGVPFTTTLGGYISVEEVSGVLLSGTFAVSIDQVAPDDEQQTACSVSDGDEDDDGELDVYYGGTDCDDQDPNNFTGNPEVCDGQDNDCNGLDDAGNPGVAGEETDDDSDGEWECQGDCDDSDPVLNGLDADLDGESSCAGDCDDADPTTFDGNTETSVTCADGVDNGCDNDTNQTPVADAGADIVVTAYSNCSIGSYGSVSCPSNCNFGAAVLDGSASSDVETVPPLFTWSESSSYFSLSDTTTATPSVACSSIDPPNQLGVVIDQTAVVNLTVTDCDDATAAATVNVTCRCVTQ